MGSRQSLHCDEPVVRHERGGERVTHEGIQDHRGIMAIWTLEEMAAVAKGGINLGGLKIEKADCDAHYDEVDLDGVNADAVVGKLHRHDAHVPAGDRDVLDFGDVGSGPAGEDATETGGLGLWRRSQAF